MQEGACYLAYLTVILAWKAVGITTRHTLVPACKPRMSSTCLYSVSIHWHLSCLELVIHFMDDLQIHSSQFTQHLYLSQ